MFEIKIDLNHVKGLTLDKIENAPTAMHAGKKRALILIAAVFTFSLALMGAARLYDWKNMDQDGKITFYDNGTSSVSPEDEALKAAADRGEYTGTDVYPDRTPDASPKPGELHLFAAQSEDKVHHHWELGFAPDTSLDFSAVKSFADHAATRIYWPALDAEKTTVLESSTHFYATEEQLTDAELLYSKFGEWKAEELFRFPEEYKRNVGGQTVRFQTADDKEFTFTSIRAMDDNANYGGSGTAIIETPTVEPFESAYYVFDQGLATLTCWRKISPVVSVNPLRVGQSSRPENNMIDLCSLDGPEMTFSWQRYILESEDLKKEELITLMESISFD